MSISAQPYSLAGATPLKPMFDALGLSGFGVDSIDAGNNSETERLDLSPTERSLKSRIMTLIENNRPEIALDLMQKTMNDDRELFDEFYFDVEEALIENGYEQDAKELAQMAAAPQREEPTIDYDAVHNTLALG